MKTMKIKTSATPLIKKKQNTIVVAQLSANAVVVKASSLLPTILQIATHAII